MGPRDVRTAGLEGAPGLAVAGGATAVLGVGKEWYDRENGGPFSEKDLVWDAIGRRLADVYASSDWLSVRESSASARPWRRSGEPRSSQIFA